MSRRPPLTQAERAKRRRQRQRDGRGVLLVTVDLNDFAETLIERGLLSEEESRQRKRLAEMAGVLLGYWVADTLEKFRHA